VRAVAVLALCAAAALGGVARAGEERTLDLGEGKLARYSIVDPSGTGASSARVTALQLVRLLASGRVEDAAALSNAPQRRLEVLREYRAAVGDEEFRRVFARFLSPANRVVTEMAIGAHRLLVWDLGEAGHHLAAQYYVEVEGRFLMDDVPSETRSNLRRVMQAYRAERNSPPELAPRPSGRTD
jgi:hypothetical protein